MLKSDIKIGAVYEVKLSTGRLAHMRAKKLEESSRRHARSRFLMEDIDTGRVKYVTAAKLRKEVSMTPQLVPAKTLDDQMKRFLTIYKGCKGHVGSCHGQTCEEKMQAFLHWVAKGEQL